MNATARAYPTLDPRSPRPPAYRDLRHNLRNSIVDGAMFSLMVGFGETYVPAFVLHMGLGAIRSGLVATVPLLAGSVLQLISPLMIRKLGSYRRWVLGCAALQALTFAPLIVAAVRGTLSAPVVFFISAVYWGSGMAAGAAWNSWMGTLVPARMQTPYFTRRTRWTQLAVLAGFLLGGVALHRLPEVMPKGYAFAILFATAIFCRLISLFLLGGQTEPVKPPSGPARAVCFFEFAGILRARQQPGRILAYLLGIQLTAQIASPFFTPYMLGELHLSYSRYALLMAASFLTKVLMLPSLGRVAQRRGTRALLWIGGLGIVSLPAWWLVSQNFYYLFFIQCLSGYVWAAYDLAALLLVLESFLPEDRTRILTAFNLLNALSMSVASVFGGWILQISGGGARAYTILFAVSTAARALTLLALGGIAPQKNRPPFPMLFRTLTIRPQLGFLGISFWGGVKTWRSKTRPRR